MQLQPSHLTVKEIEQLDKKLTKLVETKGSGPKVWRELINLAIKYNPMIAREVYLCLRANEERRQELADPDFASNESGSFRHSSSMPESVLRLLQSYDPAYDFSTTKGIRALWQAFPEFRVSGKEV